MKSVSISIPAYNNEDTVLNLIEESEKVLSSITADYEIVVINDGSSDSTQKILNSIRDNKVKIFCHKINEGFGKTLKEIFTLPSKEWIFFIPGDGQIFPNEIFKLIKYINNFDLILGLRFNRKDGWMRKMFSISYNFIISLIGFSLVKDVNSVVLCRKEIFNRVNLNSKSAFIHAELFLKAKKEGFKVKEVKILHRSRKFGKSGAIKFNVIISTIWDLVKYIFGGL